MAEKKKTTKPTPKNQTKAAAAGEAEPRAEAKPKTAPKPAPKPRSAPRPKSAPKPDSAPRSEETAGNASAPKTSTASANAVPTDWAKMIVNQLIEAQRMWLEMTTQQTALVFKTVSEVMGMSQNAPTDALGKWAKQGVESFIEAQKHWSEIAMQQSEQLMQTVQSGANFGGAGDALGQAQAGAGKGLEMLVNMRTAWLDFAAEQNAQMVKALKQNLKLDDSSPVAALADFAQQTMTSYVEIQKRWLDLATQMPLFGGAPKEKK
ncbi:MAG TPA: hypothetical protein VIL74_12535 [Pyrinomonadaceae bacterium]